MAIAPASSMSLSHKISSVKQLFTYTRTSHNKGGLPGGGSPPKTTRHTKCNKTNLQGITQRSCTSILDFVVVQVQLFQRVVHLQEQATEKVGYRGIGVAHLKSDNRQKASKFTSRALARSLAPAGPMLFNPRSRLVKLLFTYTRAQQH